MERQKKKAPYFVSQNIKQGSSCEEQGPKKGLQFRKILGESDDDSERQASFDVSLFQFPN